MSLRKPVSLQNCARLLVPFWSRCRSRQLADDRSSIGGRAVGEIDQGRADFHALARGPVHALDPTGARRRDLDHRLVRLDRDQRLLGDHVIARRHVPADDLRVLQPFAEVGKREGLHR